MVLCGQVLEVRHSDTEQADAQGKLFADEFNGDLRLDNFGPSSEPLSAG